ncbi:hypothetical protein BDY21DRAFT_364675 [Lineolata rhizophorae]|uniref:DNA-directed DNA polymerase n=1 Tax=Lineolata rhizophorae TaxID=578093 RepID=A0A6A6NXG1_9PEZI|nr:hypothetical protein BDY21DRAFT_364675 [Lineolata rhizophorae]
MAPRTLRDPSSSHTIGFSSSTLFDPTSSPQQPPSSPPAATSTTSATPNSLDLHCLPPIFVIPAHLDSDAQDEVEEELAASHAPLTYSVHEARLFVGLVRSKKRAALELRTRGLWTEEVVREDKSVQEEVKEKVSRGREGGSEPPRKRVKVDGGVAKEDVETASETEVETASEASETESESAPSDHVPAESTIEPSKGNAEAQYAVDGSSVQLQPHPKSPAEDPPGALQFQDHLRVISLDWLRDSLKAGRVMSVGKYVVYECRAIEKPTAPQRQQTLIPRQQIQKVIPARKAQIAAQHPQSQRQQQPSSSQQILDRARADAGEGPRVNQRYHPRRTGLALDVKKPRSQLLQQTTTPEDASPTNADSGPLPPPPDWVAQHVKYACERSTPADTPNAAFVEQLKRIRLARELRDDDIGVRAYSTSIAAVAAYPHEIRAAREVLRLPGCSEKIATLWREFSGSEDGTVAEAREVDDDETLRTLRLFYNIWGVGAKAARHFSLDKGWKDLDDAVEFGWGQLSRVQQIGVKFYDEFAERIPRSETEHIVQVVREHARRVCPVDPDGIEILIVGGYRRGAETSGDVDVIVSHRKLDATMNLVEDIVAALEQSGYITHTLTLSLQGTSRGQATLPFRSSNGAGLGFDTLDKALVVWQDPEWPGKASAAETNAKNPNIHRRVDIIVSPWRTVGCAALGWSGGTTFQRDVRRYAQAVKGWKFDSSGIRDRRTGKVVDLEGPDGVGRGEGIVDAEKKVFEGLGLVYREPWERCTG